MPNVMIEIAMSILGKLVTERFVSRMIVIALRAISKKTSNGVDNLICESVNDALGDPCEK